MMNSLVDISEQPLGDSKVQEFLAGLSEQQLGDSAGSQSNKEGNGGLMDYAFTQVQKNAGIGTKASDPYTTTEGTSKSHGNALKFLVSLSEQQLGDRAGSQGNKDVMSSLVDLSEQQLADSNALDFLVGLSEQQPVDRAGSQGNKKCNGGLMDDALTHVQMNAGIGTKDSYPYTNTEGMSKSHGNILKPLVSLSEQQLVDRAGPQGNMEGNGSRVNSLVGLSEQQLVDSKVLEVVASLSDQQLMDSAGTQGNMGRNGGLMDYAFKNAGIDTKASDPYTNTEETSKSHGNGRRFLDGLSEQRLVDSAGSQGNRENNGGPKNSLIGLSEQKTVDSAELQGNMRGNGGLKDYDVTHVQKNGDTCTDASYHHTAKAADKVSKSNTAEARQDEPTAHDKRTTRQHHVVEDTEDFTNDYSGFGRKMDVTKGHTAQTPEAKANCPLRMLAAVAGSTAVLREKRILTILLLGEVAAMTAGEEGEINEEKRERSEEGEQETGRITTALAAIVTGLGRVDSSTGGENEEKARKGCKRTRTREKGRREGESRREQREKDRGQEKRRRKKNRRVDTK